MNDVKHVVIAGGGTAGWLAAAAIAKILGSRVKVTLVESDQIGTVSVGEASIPTMVAFHRLLGINEKEFLQATQGTFKLGVGFENWGAQGEKYIHAFGSVGQACWAGEFQHFWVKGQKLGLQDSYGDYCFAHQAAVAKKFAITTEPHLNYAYHLDSSRYAKFLRKFSEGFGAKRIEGKISEVLTHSTTGFIQALKLESGQFIKGDFFIDCTGFRGLLIEETLKTGYQDWSHWLPCDRALAVQTESTGNAVPYTRSIAHESGWQWQIPLQHRVGNGLVYSSRFLTDEDAKATLMANLPGKPLTEPRVIKFRSGHRNKGWNKNCVALGLASGFIEPLESTSIHLVTSGLICLLRLFPTHGVKQIQIDEYNRQYRAEIETVRDFIILHYHATRRDDSEFWRYLRNMEIPASLAHRLRLFKQTGSIFLDAEELFRADNWTQIMIGQGVIPEAYHPVVDSMSDDELKKFLRGFKDHIARNVNLLPAHNSFVERYCSSAEILESVS